MADTERLARIQTRDLMFNRIATLKGTALAGAVTAVSLLSPAVAGAAEDSLILPNLRQQKFFGVDGHTLLMVGLVIAVLGIVFGLVIYKQLQNLPVHKSMLDVSDLIYETCKTYLLNQGRFILILWVCIAAVMAWYFGFLRGNAETNLTGVKDVDLQQYSKGFQVVI